MTELEERILSSARERDALSVDDLLREIERHHPAEEPGVPRETLVEYGRALTDADLTLDARADSLGSAPAFTDGTVQHELDERLMDDESWVGEEALYEIGDNHVSNYPSRWHDEIGGTTDFTECVAFVRDESAFKEAPGVGTEEGVPEGIVFDVATVVGGFTPEEATERLEERKEQGEILEDRTTGPSGGLKTRSGTDTSDLPPVIDIRDALDEIEASAEPDVSDEIDDIRELLAEFDERERASQESVLDDIEEDVVALRAHPTGDADRRAEGIRNRIQQYRQTPSNESATLSLADATLLDADGIPIDVAADDGGVATLNGTLLNGGEPREVVVVLTLYARDETTHQDNRNPNVRA